MSSILIVEDDHILRHIMILELSEEGHDVHAAENGEEALSMLKALKPDLILLDLIMPKMDGYAVLRALHATDAPCPILIMSNVSDPEEMAKCRELGAVDFVIKSNLDNDEFRTTVQRHLKKKKSPAKP